MAVTDSTGDVVQRIAYSAYGRPTFIDADGRTRPGPTFGPFGTVHTSAVAWQGLYNDLETGHSYNRARTLNHRLGRFLQRDPLGYVDGMSLYEYVVSDPLGSVDPSGLDDRRKDLGSIRITYRPGPRPGTRWADYWNGNDRFISALEPDRHANKDERDQDMDRYVESYENHASEMTGTIEEASGVVGDILEDTIESTAPAAGYTAITGKRLSKPIDSEKVSTAEQAWSWGALGLRLLPGLPGLKRNPCSAERRVAVNANKIEKARPVTGAVGHNAADSALHNAAEFERYKKALRRSMQKPAVTDSKLARMMDDLYREGAQVGSGSTADAVRHELATGQKVGGKYHSQKAQEYIAGLQDWLGQNPNASSGDRAAAENVIADLQNALMED